ncbi:MAG: type II toxin-antitoxin system VapC family toxin [Aestuariivirga sp.]|nr:type II toxin-antitoxin system VapC family toxin [Aestuariivirga sp.]
MTWVLDSSAILVDFLKEAGSDIVHASQGSHIVSAVNFAEVYAKLIERGLTVEKIGKLRAIEPFDVVEFDRPQAILTAQLRPMTRHLGLSLGDRACLALAIREKAAVITADRSWAGLDLGIEIKVIR